ncbi:hypothetical protein DPX16_1280 [Anabarilius grahami]|uniref:Uncharacterized protein n=1 Tax=Anabarilius grahami TaxID=495550 RepID=A0A3N0XWH4_ANAGA|nr:hypothetical protein DPX16_1280 [Anabarilius grahami]
MDRGSLVLKRSCCKQVMTDAQAFWQRHPSQMSEQMPCSPSAVRHTRQYQVTPFFTPLQHKTNIQRILDELIAPFDPGMIEWAGVGKYTEGDRGCFDRSDDRPRRLGMRGPVCLG